MIDREKLKQLAKDLGATELRENCLETPAFPWACELEIDQLERLAAAVTQMALTEAIQRLNQSTYSLTKTECIEEIRAIRARGTGGAG